METERLPTRDVREDRCERVEKLGQAVETLPGKTLRDRFPNSRGMKSRDAGARAKVRMAESALPPGAMLPVVARTRKVWFRLNAPAARRVFVAGTFNDWNPSEMPLEKSKEGEWRVERKLALGEYEYRFIVDGIWEEDPTQSAQFRIRSEVEIQLSGLRNLDRWPRRGWLYRERQGWPKRSALFYDPSLFKPKVTV